MMIDVLNTYGKPGNSAFFQCSIQSMNTITHDGRFCKLPPTKRVQLGNCKDAEAVQGGSSAYGFH
jgi:hypothetical protein